MNYVLTDVVSVAVARMKSCETKDRGVLSHFLSQEQVGVAISI